MYFTLFWAIFILFKTNENNEKEQWSCILSYFEVELVDVCTFQRMQISTLDDVRSTSLKLFHERTILNSFANTWLCRKYSKVSFVTFLITAFFQYTFRRVLLFVCNGYVLMLGLERNVIFFYKNFAYRLNEWHLKTLHILTSKKSDLYTNPADTGHKLNVHKMFRRRPGRLLNVLCTSSLRPVFTGKLIVFKRPWELTFAQHFQMITTLQFQKWSKGFLSEKKQNSQTSSFIFITIIDSLYYSITGNYIFLTLRPNIGKYGPEITPHLDTFQAVTFFRSLDSWLV